MSRFVVAACTFLMCLCIATLLAGGGFSLAIYKGMPLMFGFTSLIDTAWFTPDGALLGWILIAVTLLFTSCVVARSLYWAARNKQAQPTP